MLFSVVYFLFFQVGNNGWTLAEAWSSAQAAEMQKRFADISELHNDTATLLKYKDDGKWMAYAHSVFLSNCQSCHGPEDLTGVIGPNLTDDYYRDVKVITDIAKVIENGAGNGPTSEAGQSSSHFRDWRGQVRQRCDLPGRQVHGGRARSTADSSVSRTKRTVLGMARCSLLAEKSPCATFSRCRKSSLPVLGGLRKNPAGKLGKPIHLGRSRPYSWDPRNTGMG